MMTPKPTKLSEVLDLINKSVRDFGQNINRSHTTNYDEFVKKELDRCGGGTLVEKLYCIRRQDLRDSISKTLRDAYKLDRAIESSPYIDFGDEMELRALLTRAMNYRAHLDEFNERLSEIQDRYSDDICDVCNGDMKEDPRLAVKYLLKCDNCDFTRQIPFYGGG